MNPGKKFEADIKDSIPGDVWYHRIKDPASSFGGGKATRFSPKNEYDMLLYKYPTLVALELKSNASTSISFSLEEKKPAEIKCSQLMSLEAVRKHNIKAGLLLNFRRSGVVYYIDIESFMQFARTTPKKSVNEKDCLAMKHTIVEQQFKRTRYRYDLNFLFGRDT